MKKKQKILLMISCIILIVIFIICIIVIKKYTGDDDIEKNGIDNSVSNLSIEKDENIMVIGIIKKEVNRNETIYNNVEEKEQQNVVGTELNNISISANENKIGEGNISSIVNMVENKTDNTTVYNEQEQDAAKLTQEIYSLNSNIGTLYIPKTKLNTSVYSNSSVSQMEKIPCFLYTNGGINKKGITLIVGHNRRNGKMFSNNKKLEQGDIFYFTDIEGKKLKYIIYSKFIIKENDTSFLNDNVQVPTIALSCCTDANDDNRIIILGKAE